MIRQCRRFSVPGQYSIPTENIRLSSRVHLLVLYSTLGEPTALFPLDTEKKPYFGVPPHIREEDGVNVGSPRYTTSCFLPAHRYRNTKFAHTKVNVFINAHQKSAPLQSMRFVRSARKIRRINTYLFDIKSKLFIFL